MKIAFVGLPLAALLLAEDGLDIVWAGICRKDALGLRRLTKRLGKARVRVVLFRSDHDEEASRVAVAAAADREREREECESCAHDQNRRAETVTPVLPA